MKSVGDLVQGREVHTIGTEITVLEAAKFMSQKGIGLVPVMDGERVIVSSENGISSSGSWLKDSIPR